MYKSKWGAVCGKDTAYPKVAVNTEKKFELMLVSLWTNMSKMSQTEPPAASIKILQARQDHQELILNHREKTDNLETSFIIYN